MEQYFQICFIDYYQQKGIQLRAKLKKCAPILGYKLPSDKLTELVVRKAKPSSKPKKLTDDHDLILITYCISQVLFLNLQTFLQCGGSFPSHN